MLVPPAGKIAPSMWETPRCSIGPLVTQNNRVMSKAMDDRIGCYILIEVLRRLVNPRDEVHFVFSTQEEITLSGARTSAYQH